MQAHYIHPIDIMHALSVALNDCDIWPNSDELSVSQISETSFEIRPQLYSRTLSNDEVHRTITKLLQSAADESYSALAKHIQPLSDLIDNHISYICYKSFEWGTPIETNTESKNLSTEAQSLIKQYEPRTFAIKGTITAIIGNDIQLSVKDDQRSRSLKVVIDGDSIDDTLSQISHLDIRIRLMAREELVNGRETLTLTKLSTAKLLNYFTHLSEYLLNPESLI